MKFGAIFDLDGTLISSSDIHIRAWVKLFKLYDIKLTGSELQNQSGRKQVSFIKDVLESRSKKNLDPERLSSQKDEIILELLKKRPPTVFPKAEAFLELLKERKISLALASSAPRKTAVLLGQKIVPYFDYMVFAEDVKIGKPNPEIFLKAAKGLGLSTSKCVVFEDAESGIEAAKNGGFYCIAKDNNLGQNLSKADAIIKDYKPNKLLKYFG